MFRTRIWPAAFFPCSILTQPAFQRRKPPLPDDHLDWCGPTLGDTISFSLGSTLALKLNLPRICPDVGVSQHGESCYLSPLLGQTLCSPITQGILQTTFADGGCPQEHQLEKSKRISLSPRWTSLQNSHHPLPSSHPSPSDEDAKRY